MRALIKRDKKRRELFKSNEMKYLIIKSIVRDLRLSYDVRNYYKKLLHLIILNASIVRIRNRCILTGNPHSIIRYFRLTHKQILILGFRGYLNIKDSSW